MLRRIACQTFLVVLLALALTGAAGAAPPPQGPPFKIDLPTILLDSDATNAYPTVSAPDPVVRWMIDQVDQDTIRQYTGDLSGEWPVTVRGSRVTITTRNTNSGTPIQNATYYVGDHLAARGLAVEYHEWLKPTAPNVIGEKTGTTAPGDIYMITAHLDDMPTGSNAPGADDNASGSTAVLVAADILSQFEWNCTLRFALWTGEEQGLLGSDKYAKRASDNNENIIAVFNLDMIGWNTPGSTPDIELHAKGSLPRSVDLANQTASVIAAYGLNLVPAVYSDVTGSSDHVSFWKYGYDAILGIEDYYSTEDDFNPYYHTTGDKLSALNIDYFTEYVKAAVAETAHMSGCLVTGTLHGNVTSAHDGTAIGGAEITLTDAAARSYKLKTSGSGGYNQPVPPSAYGAGVTAYGFADATGSGIAVVGDGATTADFALTALPPSAPLAAGGLETGEVKLNWLHVGPNTAYAVRRSVDPYFAPGDGEEVTAIPAAHPPAPDETLSWRDAESGAGHTGINHFYVVVGQNAAGAGAASNRMGEFDFMLVKP
ncbi:MAG: M28 family peptidase [Anaerolineae bacterium]|jgi:hypothetical protein|nr:M28 family peptidase [Anaerolineae bacterium]